jgi:hypothetical protein
MWAPAWPQYTNDTAKLKTENAQLLNMADELMGSLEAERSKHAA